MVGREAIVAGNFQNTDIPKVLDGLLIKDEIFSLEEFKEAKLQLSEEKRSRPDNIIAEVIKKCNLEGIILEFANKLLDENVKPEQWSEVSMITIQKSRNLSDRNNYRGISLASTVANGE